MSVVLALMIAIGAAMNVMAVHDISFELDGDAVDNPATTPPWDWSNIFDANGDNIAPLPAGFDAAVLQRDFVSNNGTMSTSDNTTYATGSKDTLPISGWQCNVDNNVNSKVDIMNAYAASFTAGDDEFLYFGLERNVNTGDSNVAFWFLQGEVGCESAGGAVTFSGAHRDGDLLIVSAFSNGGTVSTIDVYRWNIPDPDNDPIGSLGTTPVGSGVDCRDPLLPAGDDACGAANNVDNGVNGTITVPWLTASGKNTGHSLPRAQFFEGGVNLSDLNLGGKCFNTFVGNTRSSTSLTATLFDFAAGTLGECTSTTVTTPSITSPTSIGAAASLIVTDSATVTVDGADTWDGDVSFHLCGPFAADATTRCETGGVDAGTKAVSNGTPTVVSDQMTITSAGRYCWRADFAPDEETSADIPPSSDARESECFLITPLTAGLVTQAGAGPVNFGLPVSDTATLSGTANRPGSGGPSGSNGSINPTTAGGPAQGTITFTLYKNDCTTLASGTGTNPQVVQVLGNAVYGPVSFTPDAPGTYHWVATYSGDLPNTVGITHNATCADPNESVIVRQIPTEIKTKQSWIPNDTATITSTVGNLVAGGNVVFSLYANATCSGDAVFSETVAVPGGNPTAEVSTSNTSTFKVLTGYTDAANSVVSYSWKIVYTPAAGGAHTGKQSACDAEKFTITYTNDPGPGTNLP